MIHHPRKRERVNGAMRRRGKRGPQVRTFLLFGTLLTLVLILLISTVGRQQFGSSHKFALEVIGPVQGVASRVVGYYRGLWQDYRGLWDVREENKRLLTRLQEAEAANNRYREAMATNARLSKLLDFKEGLPPPTLTARIVGRDPSLWFQTLIIDRGSSDGIEKGMPAVTIEGIVGQVLTASPHFAKVLLATDPNSAIDVLVQRNRVRGILKGDGNGGYQLQYVLKSNDVQQDDWIETSELGGIFPKGIPAGKVSKVAEDKRGMFQAIEVAPAVDFSRLEELIIIMNKNPLAD